MISRCLWPFVLVFLRSRDEARKYYAALPETCPHSDCSAKANCRAVCSGWAKGRA
jgi:hypothetical protein